jgi:hypothetical protein
MNTRSCISIQHHNRPLDRETKALRRLPRGSEQRSMQDPGCERPRIRLPGTSVNSIAARRASYPFYGSACLVSYSTTLPSHNNRCTATEPEQSRTEQENGGARIAENLINKPKSLTCQYGIELVGRIPKPRVGGSNPSRRTLGFPIGKQNPPHSGRPRSCAGALFTATGTTSVAQALHLNCR